LKNYINNVSNTGKLKEHVQLATAKITKSLRANLPKVNDEIIKVKLQEVIVQLLAINEAKAIKDSQVLSIMRAHELAQELRRVVK
jgi:lipase chaperone LimK